ncbi:TasA family protein [Nocardioides pacificus]
MKLAASKATTAKILASVVLVGGAASVAGLGTFGAFTSTTTAQQSVGSGTVTLDMTQPTTQGLGVAATGMVPGDRIERAVTLTRSGSELFGTVSLTTASVATPTPSILTTNTTMGLQLAVDSCDKAWTVAADKSLTCSGITTSVLASSPVVAANRPLGSVTTALNNEAIKVANLRVTLALPTAADDTFQGKSDSISFKFDATQRAGKAL